MRNYYKLQIRNGTTKTNHVDEVLKDNRITSHIDYAGVEFEKLNKGDVLLIHKGSYPVCLVEVLYKITNKNEINGTDFGINYKVKILSYFEDLEESFKKNNEKVGHNGTFFPLYNDTKTLRFVKKWFDYIQRKENMEDIKALLEYKKQIILQGPPGTGKTRLAKILANEIMKPIEISIEDISYNIAIGMIIKTSSGKSSFKITKIENDRLVYQRLSTLEFGALNFIEIQNAYKDKIWLGNIVNGSDTYRGGVAKYLYENYKSERCQLIQFHPSYTYEDFVRGIISVPNDNGEGILYKTENKILADFAEKALKNKLNSQKDPTVLSKEMWLNEQLMSFKESLENELLESEEILIKTGTLPKITAIEENSIRVNRYSNENDSILIKDTDIINGYIGLYLTIPNIKIKENNVLSKSARSGMYYLYQNIIEKFYEYNNKNNKKFVQNTSLKEPLKNYILIIDEINRANLPSVLGELIYTLEYRDEAVESMYAIDKKNELILPSNLFIIGTMNTADRSVGHIDYAIKRRFAFVDVLPTDQAIDDVITESSLNLKAKSLYKKVAELFNEQSDKPVYLQSDFKAKDVQLGHSYFLAKTEKQLELKLAFEIKPLLNEYVKDGILSEETKKEIESLRI